MITVMWVSLAVFAVLSVAAIITGVVAIWRDWHADDPRPPVTDMDMTMPPEIAHDEFGPAQRWHEETSPVRTRPAPSGAGAPPGTAAAAGPLPAPAPPPPLPGHDWAEVAQFAADNPGREPFAVWEIDQFVDAYNAITGGAS